MHIAQTWKRSLNQKGLFVWLIKFKLHRASVALTNMFSRLCEVTDHLYLGGAAVASEAHCTKAGITQVINCTMDVPEVKDVKNVRISVDDTPSANLEPYFDKVADLINEEVQNRGKTLVHCVAGVSRSASFCIGYMIKYHHLSLKEAYNFVKEKRTVIRPNIGFFRQLIDYEVKVTGQQSVHMVDSPIGCLPDVYEEQTRHMVWLPDHPETG